MNISLGCRPCGATMRYWSRFLLLQVCCGLSITLCSFDLSEPDARMVCRMFTEIFDSQFTNPLAQCKGKRVYCGTGVRRHWWPIARGKWTQKHMHTHTLLNFSTTGNNILALFEYGSTQGKKKISIVTLILIGKLQLEAGVGGLG